ncbi:MAG: hypothetical protein AAFP90_03970 [Planctomycetota bacterium]
MSDESTPESIDPKSIKRVSVDGQTVETHSLKDQQDAEDRAAAKRQAKRGVFGMRRARLRPGDAV